ncbi:hypothetical protein OHA37_13465 [Streptomyces sp. NBC_00335]|uniref:hypothetical protein n=1 Tax=unclassified Streptomyces TaxID=2593676 RepID=UPI0022565886|nr:MULTISPECIES: hypothetical protein [unclassified Streptomyces]MCX5404888.1 hypothetical protein [Streptomyces sp. NBC_00086]
MPEPMAGFTYCEPCPRCVFHAWQLIERGRLLWRSEWECDTCGFGAPDTCNLDEGPGRPPEHVRAAVVEAEGTVLLQVGGARSAALKAFRDELGLTMQELLAAVRDGYRATPVEARHLMALLQESGGLGGPGVTAPPPL